MILMSLSDAAFIAGISAYISNTTYHFDTEILNPGGHFDPGDGSYTCPYSGIYQSMIEVCYANTQV